MSAAIQCDVCKLFYSGDKVDEFQTIRIAAGPTAAKSMDVCSCCGQLSGVSEEKLEGMHIADRMMMILNCVIRIKVMQADKKKRKRET
jgi:hypothetical protein